MPWWNFHSCPAADPLAAARQMVESQLRPRGIHDPRVLQAMARIPREPFLTPDLHATAYTDHPLPIGHGQTLSQPYIVAYMLQDLRLQPHHRVLEVGSGCGYVTALLSALAAGVFAVEILPDLARRAADTLQQLGCDNIHLRAGDGSAGWPEAAPFDAILVSCCPLEIPDALLRQLASPGRLICPVGPAEDQYLILVEHNAGTFTQHPLIPVRFVPMT